MFVTFINMALDPEFFAPLHRLGFFKHGQHRDVLKGLNIIAFILDDSRKCYIFRQPQLICKFSHNMLK